MFNKKGLDKESTNQLARAINDLGIAYVRLAIYDSAKLAHFKSLDHYKIYNDQQGHAFNYNNLAIINRRIGQKDSCYFYQKQGIKAAKAADDTVGVGYGNMNLGIYYAHDTEYVSSLTFLLKAKNIFEDLKDTARVNMVKTRISSCYLQINDYKSAINILNGLPQYYKNKKNNYYNGLIYYKLAEAYNESSELDSALHFINLSLLYYNKLENKRWTARALVVNGNLYYKKREYSNALESYQKTIKVSENKHVWNEIGAKTGLVKTYVALKDYSKASIIANELLEKYDNRVRANQKNTLYNALYLYEKERKNFDKALLHFEKWKFLEDSVFSKEKNLGYARIEYNYKLDKEKAIFDSENEKIGLELEKQKQLFIFSIIGTLALVILFILSVRSYLIKKKANKKLKILNKEIANQKEEITQQAEELRTTNDKLVELGEFKESVNSMIVHDLKNPISSIIALSEHKKVKQMAYKMLNLVYDILDVQKLKSANITLNQKEYFLNEIIAEAINQVEFLISDKEIKLTTKIFENSKVQLDYDLITRVLVNLLSNAIKNSPIRGDLVIESSVENQEELKISVNDEGIGIPKEKQKHIFDKFEQIDQKKSNQIRSTGLGLTFCKMAIEAHNGKIGVNSKEGDGSKFWFTIPYFGKNEITKLKVEEINVSEKDTFKLQDSDKEKLESFLPQLKSFKMFESAEIEDLLESIETDKDSQLDNFIKQIIDAAYNNNEEKYHELIEGIDKN